MSDLLYIQRTGDIRVSDKAGYLPAGHLAVVGVINDDHWVPPLSSLLLLGHRGLLVLSEDVGERETVKLPDSGEDRDGELVTDVTKEVWEV